jgi:V-type H+-transporting ATPase subunit E
MIKLMEDVIHIKCRREDLALVKSSVDFSEKEYASIMMRETNEEYKTKIIVNETDFLTIEEGGECGGIILYTPNKRIVCPNTLKNRLDLCFEELLPEIRK